MTYFLLRKLVGAGMKLATDACSIWACQIKVCLYRAVGCYCHLPSADLRRKNNISWENTIFMA